MKLQNFTQQGTENFYSSGLADGGPDADGATTT